MVTCFQRVLAFEKRRQRAKRTVCSTQMSSTHIAVTTPHDTTIVLGRGPSEHLAKLDHNFFNMRPQTSLKNAIENSRRALSIGRGRGGRRNRHPELWSDRAPLLDNAYRNHLWPRRALHSVSNNISLFKGFLGIPLMTSLHSVSSSHCQATANWVEHTV